MWLPSLVGEVRVVCCCLYPRLHGHNKFYGIITCAGCNDSASNGNTRPKIIGLWVTWSPGLGDKRLRVTFWADAVAALYFTVATLKTRQPSSCCWNYSFTSLLWSITCSEVTFTARRLIFLIAIEWKLSTIYSHGSHLLVCLLLGVDNMIVNCD